MHKMRVGGITLLALITGCAEAARGTFVGGAEGSDLLLGVVSDGTAVRAYACDGESISEWFMGDDIDQPLASASGATLSIQRSTAPVAELTLGPDRVFTIQTSPVDGDRTGVFRAERDPSGMPVVAGWVVLPDGTQRGAVQQGDVILFGQMLDLTTLTANVQGIGTVQAFQLDPDSI